MRHVIASLTVVAMLSGATQALANSGMFPLGDGDIANGEKIFLNGKELVEHVSPPAGEGTPVGEAAEARAGIEVPACITCHGANGEGNDDLGTPRIAGQFFSFLVKQLEDFAADKRTDTTMFVMNNNAKGLTTQERRDVATYLAAKQANFAGSDLDALKAQGVEVGEAHKGKALVEYGSPVRNDGFPKEFGSKGPGASACKSCHDYAGRGAPPIYPMIGQQRYVYLVNQLKKWRDGSRANDPMGQMQAIARKLSDQDILNAAAYLTGAGPLSMGNTHSPYDRHDRH